MRPGKIAELKKEWPLLHRYHKSKNMYLRIKEAWNESEAKNEDREDDVNPPGTSFFIMFLLQEIFSTALEQRQAIKHIFSSIPKKQNYSLRIDQYEQILLRRKLALCLRNLAFNLKSDNGAVRDSSEATDQPQIIEQTPIADLLQAYIEKLASMTCAQNHESRATISQFIKDEYPKLIEQIKAHLKNKELNINAIDYYGYTAEGVNLFFIRACIIIPLPSFINFSQVAAI